MKSICYFRRGGNGGWFWSQAGWVQSVWELVRPLMSSAPHCYVPHPPPKSGDVFPREGTQRIKDREQATLTHSWGHICHAVLTTWRLRTRGIKNECKDPWPLPLRFWLPDPSPLDTNWKILPWRIYLFQSRKDKDICTWNSPTNGPHRSIYSVAQNWGAS